MNDLIKSKKINLFLTEEDKYETDITKMSDFFSSYLGSLTSKLKTNDVNIIPDKLSKLSILEECISNVKMIKNKDFTLIPDYNSLKSDIIKKLKTGEYKLGESKQVNGNLRAVIVDKNNVRVKDLTFKKAVLDEEGTLISNDINIHSQLEEIHVLLNNVIDLQKYQIEQTRNQALIVPFMDARDKLLKAQRTKNESEKVKLIESANDLLSHGINSIYQDINITAYNFANTRDGIKNKIINTINNNFENYMNYLAADIQMIFIYNGIYLQTLEYLGDRNTKDEVTYKFIRVLNNLATKVVTNDNLTVLELLQNNYKYKMLEDDFNYWIKLSNYVTSIKEKYDKDEFNLINKNIYLLSMEEEK